MQESRDTYVTLEASGQRQNLFRICIIEFPFIALLPALKGECLKHMLEKRLTVKICLSFPLSKEVAGLDELVLIFLELNQRFQQQCFQIQHWLLPCI